MRASGSQGAAYRELWRRAQPNRRPHYASSRFGPGPTGESVSALRSPFTVRPVCAFVMAAVVAWGCTTMRVVQRPVAPGNIDSAASVMATVRPGDEVRVTLRDGRQFRFEVLAVDSAGNAVNAWAMSYQRFLSPTTKLQLPHEIFLDEGRRLTPGQRRYTQTTLRMQFRF